MSDYIRGLETFNSCNKAGSIPHFTRHLEKHPDDYKALMRRATAHKIIGNDRECKADVARAIKVSSGVEKMAAEVEMAQLAGNTAQFNFLREKIVQLYPSYAPGWSKLADILFYAQNYDGALPLLQKAIETAKENQQTDAPNYCWDNYHLGDIYARKGELDFAEKYFKAAIESSSSLTVAHIGLSKVYLMKHKLHEARQCFDTARRLNPTLVHWESFDAFQYDLENPARAAQQTLEEQMEHMRLQSKVARNKMAPGKTTISGGSRKNNVGGNDGSGSGTDDDDDDSDTAANKLWDKLKSESPWKARYRGKIIVQSKCGNYWYSRDKAEHGGCRFKVYDDKRSSLQFSHGADKKLNKIEGKHESMEGTKISKNDLNTDKK